jgi:hypothetical protein
MNWHLKKIKINQYLKNKNNISRFQKTKILIINILINIIIQMLKK